MAVKSIRFVSQVDNEPNVEDTEGITWTNQRIYKLAHDDGSEQFLALDFDVDSYGQEQTFAGLRLVQRTTKTVEVWA